MICISNFVVLWDCRGNGMSFWNDFEANTFAFVHGIERVWNELLKEVEGKPIFCKFQNFFF